MKRELSLDEIKSLQVLILDEIHKFCQENNLRYSLSYGTMLGAVRHKGYIPWDDDIDIWMPRPDYNAFMSNFISDRYKTVHSDNGIEIPFGKVYDSHTVMIENAVHSYSPGIYVDIFPLDYYPADSSNAVRIRKKIKDLYRLKTVKDIRLSKRRALIKNIILSCLKVASSFLSYYTIINRLHRLMTETKSEDALEMTDYNAYANDIRLTKEETEKVCLLEFEGRRFYSFENYDKLLRSTYGDYMQLPPEDKRVSTHDNVVYLK